jgi:hypothetical protein
VAGLLALVASWNDGFDSGEAWQGFGLVVVAPSPSP